MSEKTYFGKTNVVMVGMPGAGKSTIGVLLAKEMSLDFLDVDVYMQGREGRRLQDIIDNEGIEFFSEMEDRYLQEISVMDTIISTGGSAIYAVDGMKHLKRRGVVIFLKINMKTLEERLGDFSTRGVVMRAGQTFEQLFQERNKLYSAEADEVIECDGKNQETLVKEIIERLFN
jgi:shikimate kinase